MNILVFTSIYPIKGTKQGFTPVVKTFCEDWAKLGHNVLVISSSTKFPFFYYFLPNKLNEIIENTVGFNIPNSTSRKRIKIKENNVEVLQYPVFKKYPGEIVGESKLYSNFLNLKKEVLDLFNPDIAIGHWVNPQIMYLNFVKKEYNIKTFLILHNKPTINEIKQVIKYKDSIDTFGFRSTTIMKESNELLNLKGRNQFLCYSGIEDVYNISDKEFQPKFIDKNNIKICFVGNLIARKFPEAIINVVNEISSSNFEIHYVGEGRMRPIIEKKTTSANVKVFIHGRLSKQEVYEVLSECDFLVMISKDEAFGLVYLEAMLNRTIPIASKNEGFDGIIVDKVNGYLCKAGDETELKNIFLSIIESDIDSIYNIQRMSYNTAIKMTNKKMALEYLKNINNENKK